MKKAAICLKEGRNNIDNTIVGIIPIRLKRGRNIVLLISISKEDRIDVLERKFPRNYL